MVSEMAKVIVLAIGLNAVIIFMAVTYFYFGSFSQDVLLLSEQQIADASSMEIKEARAHWLSVRNTGFAPVYTSQISVAVNGQKTKCVWRELDIAYSSTASCILEEACNGKVTVSYRGRFSDEARCF